MLEVAEPGGTEAARARTALYASVAEAVVSGALLAVAQDGDTPSSIP